MSTARILLADDNASILETVADLLTPQFHLVASVTSGRALVEAAEMIQPDVLLVDISLPDMSGIEAVDVVRRTGNGARVVFLTVHSDSDFIRAAFAAGAFGYVIKSHMVTDLVRAITEALEGRVFVSSPLVKTHSKNN